MGSIKYMAALLMTALFAIAIVGFSVNFGNENDAKVLLSNDSDFAQYKSDLVSDVDTFHSATNESLSDLAKSTATPGDEVSTSGEQFKVTSSSLLSITKNVITSSFEKIFGENKTTGIVLTGLIGFLALVGALYVYKTWFGKNPD